MPSKHGQPKFDPAAVPSSLKSTSSLVPAPTSPIVRSPVERSNENRYGLRSPKTKISSASPPGPSASGFPGGIEYCAGGGAARVDPQDLAEEGRHVLGLVRGVATVPGRYVEHPVGPELELAPVVVGSGVVRDHEDIAAAGRVSQFRVRRRARNSSITRSGMADVGPRPDIARVEDVEQAAARVVGREGHREHPAFTAALAADVPHARVDARNGVACVTPPLTSLMRPAASTTKTRLASPGGAATWKGVASSGRRRASADRLRTGGRSRDQTACDDRDRREKAHPSICA